MLLPLQKLSSIKLKVLGVGVVILLSPTQRNSVISQFQTVLFKIFFFGINYHGKINGCNFTKLTGMKSKKKKAILNKHENNYTSKVEKGLIVNDFLSRFSLTQR